MFKLEQTDFGIKVTIRGLMDVDEANRLRSELVLLVTRQDGDFSALVDVRESIPAEYEPKAMLQHCEEIALKAGMRRMATIFESPVIKGQVQQNAHLSGTAGIARHIDASKVANAEQVALAWVRDGIPPEASDSPVDDLTRIVPSER